MTENFEYFVIAEEVEQILLKTQESLPGKCKEIFILAMQGKDNEAIAKTLNISVNTVKTQKKIAYKKIESLLSKHNFEELRRCVERYAKETKGKDQQYIQYGSTFLNGGYVDYLGENYKPDVHQSTNWMDVHSL